MFRMTQRQARGFAWCEVMGEPMRGGRKMSRKNVSAIVSDAGWIGGFVHLLVREMHRQGWTDEQIHTLVSETAPEEQMIQRIVALLMSECKLAGDTYSIAVDYTRTLAAMIAAGEYDYINLDVTKAHFSIQRPSANKVASDGGPYRKSVNQNKNTEVVLVHLTRVASEDEALFHMDKLGLRPARIEELLAFGEKYPDLQRQFPIVALGSRWRGSGGRWCVVCLRRCGSGRGLRLYWFHHGFVPFCRFLASRK